MEKWLPIFWIFVICGGFLAFLLLADFLKGKMKRRS